MDFLGYLLLTCFILSILVYLCKKYFKTEEYTLEEENTPEDLEFLQHHINNINNVAVNYNPRTNTDENEVPPKYEDINTTPNYPFLNSS
jgi:hypothetical protein